MKLFEHIKNNSFKLNEHVHQLMVMSKLEEQEALNYVKKMVIPEIVEHWNLFHSTPITLKDMLKGLKKSEKTDAYNKVYTYSVSTGSIDIVILKWEEKGMDVKVYWYSGPHMGQVLPISTAGKMKLEENKNPNDITKMEEDQGLTYIRKFIIPRAVENWNRISTRTTTGVKPESKKKVTTEQVSKNLKKVDHEKTGPNTYEIEYQSYIRFDPKIPGSGVGFSFSIRKYRGGGLYLSWYHSSSVGEEIPMTILIR
jgi:hypothetical protein